MKRLVYILIGILVLAFAWPRSHGRVGPRTADEKHITTVESMFTPTLPGEVDEIAVELRSGVGTSNIQTLSDQLHIELRPNSPFSEETGVYVARVKRPRMPSVLAALQHDPRVESAEPNSLLTGLWDPNDVEVFQKVSRRSPPNDPLYKYQWHMQKINVEQAWTAASGKGVVVAVIDTGVAYEDYERFHEVEDLKQTNFVKGWNFVSGNEHANDDNGHGTHVAGTIAQSTNNGIGCVGVAPQALIMPIKVLSASGTGKISNIAEGIRLAANKGAKVINMSLGGPLPSGILESALKHAHKKGVIIVCAAGNSNSENVSYPARYPQCIAVSATRFDDELTFYTNRGKRIDIAAPGGDMRVDQNDDGYKDGVLQNTIGMMDPTTETYALYQGTSMASPHVAGAAALLVSMGITRPDAVRARLVDTARKEGFDLEKGYGGGVLDAGKATFQTAFMDPLTRLALGILMLFGLLRLSPLRRIMGVPLTILTLLGLIGGSAGFFFLPYVGISTPSIFIEALPDWDLSLAGVNAHANALFWSALIPFGLATCTFGERRLQSLCMGLSIGTAAFLCHQLLHGTADIQGVPGWLLGKGWLLLNVGACLFLAYVLGFSPRTEEWTRSDADPDS